MMKFSELIQKTRVQRIAASLLVGIGLVLLLFSLQKDITLVVNGRVKQIQTFALTSRKVLEQQELPLTPADRVSPSPGVFLWGGETIYYSSSTPVEVDVDGDQFSVQTAERYPENILLNLGVKLYPRDRLLVNGTLFQEDDILLPGAEYQLEILRGTPITLVTEGSSIQFTTDADTLEEAIHKQGIEIFQADQLSRPRDTALDGSPITVELIRAKPVQVHLEDKTVTIHTTADTVGAALAQGGIPLQGLDYSLPEEMAPLPDDRQVQIIRVREEVILNQEQIQFSTEYQPADDLELDQLSILNGGEFGLNAQRVRITYENGQEVSRELEKEWVLKDPVPRVIGYGTQINIRTANTPEGQIKYWRKITAYATSYNENCEGCKTYTSSGADLRQGVIAVRLEWYRYMKGLKVYIPGYGFASIEDVGGGVPWSYNWVDLGYKAKNYVPWSENVEVYFLAPPPPPDDIMYVLN
jgi:uncharacterized protein YabE (DUF348 family)